MIFQTAAASTAVPQEVLSRVVSTAKTEVEHLAECDKIAGVARLDGSHGLCAWVRDTKAWERFEEPERSAVEAVATNTPRPGHSVLGKGTFEAAKEAEKAELERKRVLRKDAEEAKRVAKVAVAAMKQRERLLQAKLRAGVAMSQKDRAEAQQLELDARIEERRKQQLKEASGRDLLQACLNNDSSDSDDEVEEAD